MTEQNKCKFNKPDGSQCGSWAMQGSEFCFLHNPEIPEEIKKEVQSKGGQGNRIKVFEPLPPVEIKKGRDVILLLESTINEVRAGRMELKVANCIGFLAGHLIKAIESSQIEEKVDAIQRLILEKRIIQ